MGDYATSKAYLPEQDLSDGVLKIGLFEGTVGKVTVKDNRWTKTGYIKNRVAPVPGELLKISELEQDVIKFNANNAIKLKVGLSAGEEPGTTDITLNAQDPFPFSSCVYDRQSGPSNNRYNKMGRYVNRR